MTCFHFLQTSFKAFELHCKIKIVQKHWCSTVYKRVVMYKLNFFFFCVCVFCLFYYVIFKYFLIKNRDHCFTITEYLLNKLYLLGENYVQEQIFFIVSYDRYFVTNVLMIQESVS